MSELSGKGGAAPFPSPTWVWDTGIGDTSSFNLVHLSDTTLHVRQDIARRKTLEKALQALEAGDSPYSSFPKGSKHISLQSIGELRWSAAAKILEIHYGSKQPLVLLEKKKGTLQDIYDELRSRLAPNTEPVEGNIGGASAIYAPVMALGFTLVLGGVFICWSIFADPNPENTGRRAGLKNLIDLGLSRLGVLGTTGIVAGIASIFMAWLIYRVRHPHAAEVVVVKPAIEGAKQ